MLYIPYKPESYHVISPKKTLEFTHLHQSIFPQDLQRALSSNPNDPDSLVRWWISWQAAE